MANNFYAQMLPAAQQEPAFGKNMVKNNAGGYVFQVSPEARLDRFLILGTESGSYYCNTDLKSNVCEAAFATCSEGVDRLTSSKGSKNNKAYV